MIKPATTRNPAHAVSRRRFVEGLAMAGSVAGLRLPMSRANAATGEPWTLRGSQFDLTIGRMPFNATGRSRIATTVNGSLPAPILRVREGDTVTINVANRLAEPTSIHWHGIRLPNGMDGVPGLTFRGIMPGETFTYRFPIVQSGTYWYHSHSGMQEQTGLYGPLIFEPREKEPYTYDREYVVMLSDWTDEDPMTVVANLKQQSDYYNYGQRTLGNFIDDSKRGGLSATLDDRLMWGKMRMSPTDIMDVTGATYTFLINGQPPASNWTALFRPGERVRLRFINGSSMSTFDVRVPGLSMTVVQADGTDIEPVEIDEFRIGVAETYDVIVAPGQEPAYTIFAQAEDRSGYARATLATGEGLRAPIPQMDPRPQRTMADMGMGGMAGMEGMPMSSKSDRASMGNMDMSGASSPGSQSDAISGMDMNSADMSSMPGRANTTGMSGMSGDQPGGGGMEMNNGSMGSMPGMSGGGTPSLQQPAMAKVPSSNADGVASTALEGTPAVDNVAMETKDRLAEAGDGLDGNGRRVLTYSDLASREMPDDHSPPSRQIEFHLTGNMERWIWGFDGKKFSEAEPIQIKLGERVRFVLINDTMMEHPIHLHGFLFQVENGQRAMPFKHTINVKPAERMSLVFTADAPGQWAFHCHLLYHMEMGMFRTVIVA